MTRAISLFQSLPEHIIEKVLGFALETYGRDFERFPQSSLSIVHSCQRWRKVFIALTCTKLRLDYSEQDEFIFMLKDPPCGLEEPQFPIANCVKTVIVQFELTPYFHDADTVNSFMNSEYANCVFDSARRLEIEYCQTTYDGSDGIYVNTSQETEHALENLKMFLLRFKGNMPNINAILFDWCFDVSEKVDHRFISAFDSMVSEVVAGVKDVEYSNKRDPAVLLQPNKSLFMDITHLRYTFFEEDPRGLEIIRRNSHSLQKLVADSMPGKAIDQMLYWDNGGCVVYSSLLELEFNYSAQQIVSDTEDCSCHFPVLKKLSVYGADPVLSSAFFNGNKVLEHLGLWNTYDDAQLINDQQRFKSYSFENLQHLALSYKYNVEQGTHINDPRAIDRYSEFADTLINASGRLSSFSLASSRYESKLVDILSNNSAAFVNIQKLKFTMTGMLFNDLISVIRNCPQLQTLQCSPINDYPSIDGIRDGDLVKHMETNMFPLSRYLTSLYLICEDCWRDHETHMAMALLVVGCPRLAIINCGLAGLDTLYSGLLNIASTDDFSNYSCRLKKIVPNK
ncbi:hypothetical protein FB645_001757 [Coemansia sp. IMI 203386]|nr:hypothetical protein FB645_001757 [Coemansia sp. IMI 203386]